MNCALQNDGMLTATYNMGKGVQSLDEPRYNVNDGRYHVARFRRSGANATLQLDDNSARAIRPQGVGRREPIYLGYQFVKSSPFAFISNLLRVYRITVI